MTKYCESKIRRMAGCSYMRNGKKRCSVLDHAHRQERCMEKICRKVWDFTNPVGRRFIFGLYRDTSGDETIVTIGVYRRAIGHFFYC